MSTNLHQLTSAHRAIRAKKRAKQNQVQRLIFDDNARREFLSGFHKRKVARLEAARAKAKEKEKQERLQSRRDRRCLLRERALANAAQVEKACGAISEEEQEWQGIPVHGDAVRDAEYENEELLATVTVVEDFDLNANYLAPPHSKSIGASESLTKSTTSSQKPSRTKQPPKTKKDRYENKHTRRREQTKQRSKKAELAGGRASRANNSLNKAKGKHKAKR